MANNSSIKVKNKDGSLKSSQQMNNEYIFEIDDINFDDDLRPYVNQDESSSDSSEHLSSDSQLHSNKTFSIKTLATSLPVNVPIWKSSRHLHDVDDSESEQNDKVILFFCSFYFYFYCHANFYFFFTIKNIYDNEFYYF